MYMFGSGVAIITPAGATPTPVNIGLLQEIQISAKSTVKELYGQYRDPLAIGAGTRKWTGKAKVARFSANVLNSIYFGASTPLGTTITQTAYEADSVPGTGPYTVTTTHSASWTADLGVIYAATGLPLTRVSSVSAAGEYSVSAGVYTFYSADAAAAVVISYNYTVTTGGLTIPIPQALIGPTLTFGLNVTGVDPTNNKQFTGNFPNVVCTDFDFSTKLEDFSMPDFQFSLFTNAAGSIGTYNFPDAF